MTSAADSRPLGTVPLGDTGVAVTRLGFGTSKLLRLHSSRERQRILDTAHDAGIRHFDTARSYGLGAAETELGAFLRRHPDATVATKFGIRVTNSGQWFRPFQGIARRVVGMVPGIRTVLRRTGTPLVAPRAFDLAEARASLDASRRALGVERIDLLFLHEPHEQCAIPDELADLLAGCRDAGRIAAWGMSGHLPDLLAVRARHPHLAGVLQYESDLVGRPRLPPVPAGPCLTFGPFASAIDAITARLRTAADREAWHRDVGAATDRGTIAGLLLAEAVTEPNTAPVVFSTTSVEHLRALVHAVGDEATQAGALRMREWIARR